MASRPAASRLGGAVAWFAGFFAVDDDWERPGRGVSRGDIALTLLIGVVSLAVLEMMRGIGNLQTVDIGPWQQRALVAATALPVALRRLWPLTVTLVATVGYFALSTYTPPMASLLSTQVAYFVVILGGVAWARSRREMLLVVGGIIAAMFLWLVWGFAVGNALQNAIVEDDVPGWHLPPSIAAAGMMATINTLFFGGAVVGGQAAWNGARQRDRLRQQAETITAQSDELRERAIVEERLRIARELHDVVAHHVSGIGVQAAAARRVLHRSPEGAHQALGQIEVSSREAVTQMRDLLGTLRSVERREDRHAPAPGLDQLRALTQERSRLGLQVSLEVVEDDATLADVPAAVGHSLYRTVQEALTNVTRHSTARQVRVAVRVQAEHVEVEITDDGRPRGTGSSGTGMGHLGLRERAASHQGVVEIGPRPMGGYRVRLRIPLERATATRAEHAEVAR